MASLGRFERPTFTFGGCHSIQAELQGRIYLFKLKNETILSTEFSIISNNMQPHYSSSDMRPRVS